MGFALYDLYVFLQDELTARMSWMRILSHLSVPSFAMGCGFYILYAKMSKR